MVMENHKSSCPSSGMERNESCRCPLFLRHDEEAGKGAFVLSDNGTSRTKAILKPDRTESLDVTGYPSYCGWHTGYEAWHFFPRALSEKEYCDPYRALKKVAANRSHKQWMECFRTIVFYTVNTKGYREWLEEEDPLEVYMLLNKLLEACHLIDVRAIDEVDGIPRRKWKDKGQQAATEQNALNQQNDILDNEKFKTNQ